MREQPPPPPHVRGRCCSDRGRRAAGINRTHLVQRGLHFRQLRLKGIQPGVLLCLLPLLGGAGILQAADALRVALLPIEQLVKLHLCAGRGAKGAGEAGGEGRLAAGAGLGEVAACSMRARGRAPCALLLSRTAPSIMEMRLSRPHIPICTAAGGKRSVCAQPALALESVCRASARGAGPARAGTVARRRSRPKARLPRPPHRASRDRDEANDDPQMLRPGPHAA